MTPRGKQNAGNRRVALVSAVRVVSRRPLQQAAEPTIFAFVVAVASRLLHSDLRTRRNRRHKERRRSTSKFGVRFVDQFERLVSGVIAPSRFSNEHHREVAAHELVVAKNVEIVVLRGVAVPQRPSERALEGRDRRENCKLASFVATTLRKVARVTREAYKRPKCRRGGCGVVGGNELNYFAGVSSPMSADDVAARAARYRRAPVDGARNVGGCSEQRLAAIEAARIFAYAFRRRYAAAARLLTRRRRWRSATTTAASRRRWSTRPRRRRAPTSLCARALPAAALAARRRRHRARRRRLDRRRRHHRRCSRRSTRRHLALLLAPPLAAAFSPR